MMNTQILNLHLEACLEDSIEKLQVTGQIMPLTYEMKKNAKIVMIALLLKIDISNFVFKASKR